MSKSEAGKLGALASAKTAKIKAQKNREEYAKNPKLCQQCGKHIPYEKRNNKFCGSSCSATYSNTRREHKKKTFTCLNCGKMKEVGKGSSGIFCDVYCQHEYSHKQYIENWKVGKVDGLVGEYGLSLHIKRYMLKKAEYKCETCGWHEVNPTTGKVPLEIHHIDGNYTNNKEENLQVLCPNCHSLTHTYKSLNKNGRKGRKKYC